MVKDDGNTLLSTFSDANSEQSVSIDAMQIAQYNANDNSPDFEATDSDIILVESREDKDRLKKQTKEIKRDNESGLTRQLNAEALRAYAEYLAKYGTPGKEATSSEVAIAKAQKNNVAASLKQPTAGQSEQLLAQNTKIQPIAQQQITEQRKALNLAPPIPPGTFGGGNGNGGPGSGQPGASNN